jgi:hypothetical protein
VSEDGVYRRVVSLPELVAMAATVCLVLLIPTAATIWVLWSQRTQELEVGRATLCQNALAVREAQAQVIHSIQHLADAVRGELGEAEWRVIQELQVAADFVCEGE